VGLRVVGRDGGRPPAAAVAICTLLRIVDWLPLLYLVGFITMLATGARQQRLGDLAARTGIARVAPIRHRGRAVTALVSPLLRVVAGSVAFVAATDEDAGGTIAASDQDEGGKTYRANTYRVAWCLVSGAMGGNPTVPSGRGRHMVCRTTAGGLDLVLVTAYRMNVAVTAENLDTVKREFEGILRG
jgi:hypothetical protein